MEVRYHPGDEINEQVKRDATEAEMFNLSIGYPPSWWMCPCGASHQRGYFQSIRIHRCLKCGYVGDGGVMAHTREELPPNV